MSEVVGATHQFHDAEYAEDWSQRFTPTPERLHLFETILQQLQSAIPADGHVVELGIGPGLSGRVSSCPPAVNLV